MHPAVQSLATAELLVHPCKIKAEMGEKLDSVHRQIIGAPPNPGSCFRF